MLLLLLLRAPESPSVCLPLLAGLVALFGAQLCPTATFVGVLLSAVCFAVLHFSPVSVLLDSWWCGW